MEGFPQCYLFQCPFFSFYTSGDICGVARDGSFLIPKSSIWGYVLELNIPVSASCQVVCPWTEPKVKTILTVGSKELEKIKRERESQINLPGITFLKQNTKFSYTTSQNLRESGIDDNSYKRNLGVFITCKFNRA